MSSITSGEAYQSSAKERSQAKTNKTRESESIQERCQYFKPNWRTYHQCELISDLDYAFLTALESTQSNLERCQVLEEFRNDLGTILTGLISKISTSESLGYTLGIINTLLEEEPQRVEWFINATGYTHHFPLCKLLLPLLLQRDRRVKSMASALLAKLFSSSRIDSNDVDVFWFMQHVLDQLRLLPNTDVCPNCCRHLQMLVRKRTNRNIFVRLHGIEIVLKAMEKSIGFQMQYQLIFSLWCISFDAAVVEGKAEKMIPCLARILAETDKTKVIRVIVATMRSILSQSSSADDVKKIAMKMLECRLPKLLDDIDAVKKKDPELEDDKKFVEAKLKRVLTELTSFDAYLCELRSGKLQWSPVHENELFWRENVEKFTAQKYAAMRALNRILELSDDKLTLAVAVYDVGEFVRHYPRGKGMIEHIGAKANIMRLLSSDDGNVRYQALIATQKMMFDNWEFFGSNSTPRDTVLRVPSRK